MFEYDKNKSFRLQKNFLGNFQGKPFSTNSFGHRDDETTVEKPANTKRILLIGDSITFGHGVLNNETYEHLLEESLNKHFSEQEEGYSIEVINTAAPMNSPYQEYYDLKRNMKFNPDIIVLQLTLNDVFDMPYIDIIGFHQNADFILRHHSSLYLFLKDMYGRVRFMDITGKNVTAKAKRKELLQIEKLILDPDDPDVQKAWSDSLGWTKQMIDMAKEQNIPFVILVTPFDFQLGTGEYTSNPQQTLRAFAKEKEVHFVDLLVFLQDVFAPFVKEDEEDERSAEEIIYDTYKEKPEMVRAFWNDLFIDYDHPSPKGHELIASILHALTLDILNSESQEKIISL